MKFTMPADPSDQARMYAAMLSRVTEAKEHVVGEMVTVASELERRTAAGEDLREIYQTRKKLHLQKLCLVDQERRLKEVISSLKISNSMESCRVDG